MVVNVGLFKPGEALAPGTLWVAEQIPGLVVADDVTHELARGYWSSYNVPYFPVIYEASGYPTLDARKGRQEGKRTTEWMDHQPDVQASDQRAPDK